MLNRESSNRDKAKGHWSVTLYSHGVMIKDWRELSETSKHVRAKRGQIKGWSSASRRRMREFMLTSLPPSEWQLLGATLTLPPEVSFSAEKDIFKAFSRSVQKAGFGMVWRMEVQRRGALHWHCLIAAPVTDSDRDTWRHFKGDGFNEFRGDTSSRVASMWHDSLQCAGFLTPAALKHSADVRGGGDDGRWLRYMQDHASKSKQSQVADGRGRHWGIVGRSVFRRSSGLGSIVFNRDDAGDRQFAVFLRYMRRWSTPLVQCNLDPVGRRLGYTCRRGHWGRSVWFKSPSHVARLLSFAKGRSVGRVGSRSAFFGIPLPSLPF